MFETYQHFLGSFEYCTFEKWIGMMYNPNTISMKLILIKDKFFNRYVGSVLIDVHLIKYIENDSSIENEYFASKMCIQLSDHYRGLGLGEKMLTAGEMLVKKAYPDKNRIGLEMVMNPISYHVFYKLTSLFYPCVNPFPNEDTENLLKRAKEYFHMKSVYEAKPYVARFEDCNIIGMPIEQYFLQLEELSPDKQYFIKETGLKTGNIILTLSIYNLLENNTIKLPAGNYERFADFEMEMKEFTTW